MTKTVSPRGGSAISASIGTKASGLSAQEQAALDRLIADVGETGLRNIIAGASGKKVARLASPDGADDAGAVHTAD